MLRPQDTSTRETKRLDGIWSFQLDGDSTGRDAGWFRAASPPRATWPCRRASTT